MAQIQYITLTNQDIAISRNPSNGTASLTSVSATSGSVVLASSNEIRKSLSVFNDATVSLYLKMGTTASSTSFSLKLAAGGYWESAASIYTGRVDGIWDSSPTGAARITEF